MLAVYAQTAGHGFVNYDDPSYVSANAQVGQAALRYEVEHGKRRWLHLDLDTTNQQGEVERLAQLGATRYAWRYPPHADYVVLEDPEGNLFCVCQKG